MKGWGEGWVQRPGGGNVLGGFRVWRRLVLRRMGEQRATRSREATGDSGIRAREWATEQLSHGGSMSRGGGRRGLRYDRRFSADPVAALRRSPLGAGQHPAGDEALVMETGQRQAGVTVVTRCDSWPALFPSEDPSSTRPPAQPLVNTNLEGGRQGSGQA